ncbi:MAG: hypothetical protein JW776_13300 [Candidatus Lokiarchaeota archaeon]|nr:hypothetical protein [Candidatus Lokiarchaeota archaeon]
MKIDKEEKPIAVYQLNDELGEFEELDLDPGVKLYELLDPAFSLLFLDPNHFKGWIWQGSEVSTRMKFLSAKLAPSVRDKFGTAMRLTTVDDGSEPMAFKILVGLQEEVDYEVDEQDTGRIKDEKDYELLDLLKRENLLLALAKTQLPIEYKRELVVVKDKIFKYKVQDKHVNGQVIQEEELVPLTESVPDGPYTFDDYIPRLLFSFNSIALIELLRRRSPQEIEIERKKHESNRLQNQQEQLNF